MSYDPILFLFALLACYFLIRLTWVVAQRSRAAHKQRFKDQY